MSRGEWCVVLGASSGTGAAVGRALALSPGLHVYGAHRGNHPQGAAALVDEVRGAGRRCHLDVADAAPAEQADMLCAALREREGPGAVRFFVHSIANASVSRLAIEREVHPKQVHKTFDSMAHSFVWWTQALLRHELLAPGARLLALSNPMVGQVLRGTAVIAASKAALHVYVRHLAAELGPLGYRVNTLTFGAVMTNALRTTIGSDDAPRFQRAVSRAVPARRLATVEEVGRVVSFLASDAADFFNGADIDFTGGETSALLDRIVFPEDS
ncbi:MAG: SDR family oxidoreductase [Deltaproteobacteria bacterium]|nr:SDR family oxidoreductase [Deltaproteobacteria bacterium]